MFKQLIFLLIASLVAGSLSAQINSDSFELKPVQLKEVIIQTSTGKENMKNVRQPANVQTSTDNLMQSINGVSMIRRGNYAWEATIRGFNAGQITQTIEGMAMFGACTDKMDPVSSYIEPANLKSVEVSYGINAVSSGNTIGGNIDYKIKQPLVGQPHKVSGLAGLGYQSNGNGKQLLSNINISGKKLGVNVNGIFRESGNYFAGGHTLIRHSQFQKWNAGISAKYLLSPHSSVLFNFIRDEACDVGYPALPMDVGYAKASIASLTLQQHFPAGIIRKMESKVYLNNIHHMMDDTHRPSSEVPVHMDMPGTSFTAGFYSKQNFALPGHRLETKIQAYQNRLHADMTMHPNGEPSMYMLTIPDAQRRLVQLSASDEIPLGEYFSLFAGGSISFVNSSIYSDEGKKMASGVLNAAGIKNETIGSVYLNPVYRADSVVTLFLSAAFTMRSPTLREMYGIYLYNPTDGYDYMGNPDLKSESSWNLSAGTKLSWTKFSTELRAYHYQVQQYIAGIYRSDLSVMTTGAKGVKQYQNLDGQVSGAELEAKWKINNALVLKTQNAVTYGLDNSGDALPNIPPFKTGNTAEYTFGQTMFSVSGIFSAAQHHVSPEKYGETETPSFFLLNAGIAHNFYFHQTRIHLNATVENLLDTKYTEHLDVNKVPRIGRNLSLQATIFF